MKYLNNDPSIKLKRKQLRKNQTATEILLWSKLRNKRLGGYKFFRQYSIGKYIVDFYSPVKKLVVEIDGGQHSTKMGIIYDELRDFYLKQHGVRVIRFWNNDVYHNLTGVLESILNKLNNSS